MSFQLLKTVSSSKGRLGKITTPHGVITTPCFMPVGTQATVKAMTPEELKGLGAEVVLANTYHLFLKPGHKVIQKLGGLHKFMHWGGPILTDSGGYQIFSLAQARKITEEGAYFQSPIDGGAPHTLTPELAIQVQEALGADITMVLDECLAHPASEDETRKSMEISLKWAARSLAAKTNHTLLFGIAQGGMYPRLRKEYITRLLELSHPRTDVVSHNFNGFAIGGLSVGEPIPQMREIAAFCAQLLPKEKPRYLMGVGTPEDLVEMIGAGFDLFDCVLPTREARTGLLYTSSGIVNIRHAQFKEDGEPIEAGCTCYACQNYSRAYLRHLHMVKEILYARLATIHNLHYYFNLIRQARSAIQEDRYDEFKRSFYAP